MAGRPSATAIEHMRPPMLRPPRARRFARMCALATSAAASSATAARRTGVRSGALRPALRYGKSMRATGSGATAASMARSDGCWLLDPAPGGLGAAEVAEAVGLPVRAVLPVDRRLAAGTEHGGIPATGPFDRAVRRLAAGLVR